MTKTTVYLDVDGVINALSKNPPRTNTGWTGEWGYELVTPIGYERSYPIHFAHELLEALTELSARPDVTVKWLTTWTHSAAEVLSGQIGFDAGKDFEVLARAVSPELYIWWKYAAIRDDWDGSSRIVWLDDDLTWNREAISWTDMLGPNVALTIAPKSELGLTKKHIEQIHLFLGAVPEPG